MGFVQRKIPGIQFILINEEIFNSCNGVADDVWFMSAER